MTQWLVNLGFNPYDHGFSLFSKTGVEITYLYFQIPLMVLVFMPAIDGLKIQWREASENLGASAWQYWRHVGGPLLAPAFLGAALLLHHRGVAVGELRRAFEHDRDVPPSMVVLDAVVDEVVDRLLDQRDIAFHPHGRGRH